MSEKALVMSTAANLSLNTNEHVTGSETICHHAVEAKICTSMLDLRSFD